MVKKYVQTGAALGMLAGATGGLSGGVGSMASGAARGMVGGAFVGMALGVASRSLDVLDKPMASKKPMVKRAPAKKMFDDRALLDMM